MTSQEYLQELAQLLQRMARLQQEYAEICMQEGADIQVQAAHRGQLVIVAVSAIGTFLALLLFGSKKQHTVRKRTEQQKLDDELITVVLPTIDPKI